MPRREPGARGRLGREAAPVSPALRKAVQACMDMSSHTLVERLTVSARLPEKDVDGGMADAIKPLLWQAVDNTMAAIEQTANDPTTDGQVAADHCIDLLNAVPEEFQDGISYLLQMLSTSAGLEGFLLGVVYAHEQRTARRRAMNGRPGR